MGKLIATINMTLDGFCDHTSMIADDQLHQHYTSLLSKSGAVIYGRITYELMLYWEAVAKNPTGNKSTDDFATTIENIPKVVFSRTLKSPGWKNARLAKKGVEEEARELKQLSAKDILVGSPSLIVELTQLGLIDEYQLTIHPVIAGSGLPLFKSISDKVLLKLLKTKTFGSGSITLYYKPSL